MAVAMASALLLLLALLGPAAALAGYIEVWRGCGVERAGLPRGYPMRRREESGIWGIFAGVEPPGDFPASPRPCRGDEFVIYPSFRESRISQAAHLGGSCVALGCLGLFFWGRDLGILGTGARAASFRWVQKIRKLRAIRGPFPREKPRLNESIWLLMDPK